MFPKQFSLKEIFAARRTCELFTPNAVCATFMSHQIDCVHVCSITSFDWAFVWLFTRMNQIMSLHIASAAEKLATNITWHWFGVGMHV